MTEKHRLHVHVPEQMDADLQAFVEDSDMFVSKAEAVRYAVNSLLQNEIAREELTDES